jgi:hypothetical protein
MATITHIVLWDASDEEVNVIVAECGKVALCMPDGSLRPEHFDFFSPPWTAKATCESCKRENGARTAEFLRSKSGKNPDWVEQSMARLKRSKPLPS